MAQQRDIESGPADRIWALIDAHAAAARRSASPWTRRGRRQYLSLVRPTSPLTLRRLALTRESYMKTGVQAGIEAVQRAAAGATIDDKTG